MEYSTKHIGSLLGRVFLITTPQSLSHWKGNSENENGEIDYDLLENHINYNEGNVSMFNKDDFLFLIFFSMSTKIEIFKTPEGLLWCDILYFNQSWDYSQKLKIHRLDDTGAAIEINDNKIVIYDATLEGEQIKNNSEGVYSVFDLPNNYDYSWVDLENGLYKLRKISIEINVDDELISLNGILLEK